MLRANTKQTSPFFKSLARTVQQDNLKCNDIPYIQYYLSPLSLSSEYLYKLTVSTQGVTLTLPYLYSQLSLGLATILGSRLLKQVYKSTITILQLQSRRLFDVFRLALLPLPPNTPSITNSLQARPTLKYLVYPNLSQSILVYPSLSQSILVYSGLFWSILAHAASRRHISVGTGTRHRP